MIAPECAPVTHAGGLGDVVLGLSRELEIRGHAVEIILPKYQCLHYDARNDIYGFSDDALRFAFFSKAALEFMLKANKRPM